MDKIEYFKLDEIEAMDLELDWIEVETAKGKQLVKSEHTAKERAKQFLHKIIREGITINGERITWSMIESHSLS